MRAWRERLVFVTIVGMPVHRELRMLTTSPSMLRIKTMMSVFGWTLDSYLDSDGMAGRQLAWRKKRLEELAEKRKWRHLRISF